MKNGSCPSDVTAAVGSPSTWIRPPNVSSAISGSKGVEGGRRGSQGVAGAKISVSGSTTEQVTSQDGVTQLLLDDGEVPIQINGAPGYTGPVASLKPKEVFTKTGQRLAA